MKIKKKWTHEKGLILTIVVLIIIIVALFNYVYLIPKSGTKQYSVKIIEINGDCEECFDVNLLAEELIKKNNLRVKSTETLDYNSRESKEMIKEYNIRTIPTLIILSKDIEKIGFDDKVFSIDKNYAVFDKSVPYIDLDTSEIKGVLQLKEIQSDNCIECSSLLKLKTQFEGLGMKIEDYEVIGSSSEKGKQIIEDNDLDFTSSLLISKNIEEYWWIFNQIKSSLIEKEDYYVLKNPLPPYIDLNDGKVKGKVDITYIENKSCEDCFNATQLKELFGELNIYFDDEKFVDVSSSEGKNLLNKYNITAIPTIILSKDISDYNSIAEILEQIGTLENDGKFVFRKLDSLNVKYQEIPN